MTSHSLNARFDRIDAALSTWPRWVFVTATVAAVLVVSVLFFSPKFQLWDFQIEGSYETTRARAFLEQTENPFAPVADLALRPRLLPALVGHVLHLGRASLALPWLGVVFLLASSAIVFLRYGLSRIQAAVATALVATTSAVIVPISWLGINDAWVSGALLWTAFGRSRAALIVCCLLVPWVDERFIIGFPLAFCLRLLLAAPNSGPSLSIIVLLRDTALHALWFIPYAVGRLSLNHEAVAEGSRNLLAWQLSAFLSWIAFTPLGWWMAFRAAWLPILFALLTLRRNAHGITPALALVSLLTMVVLAADVSRSAAIILPLLVAGIWMAARKFPRHATAGLCLVLLANLVLPAAHVVATKIDVISPLPMELYRLLRTPTWRP